MQKTEKNDTFENNDPIQGIEMQVIPVVTDVFSQTEDLFNMTPLKLVAAISAQHLITTVKNIPLAGNSYKDSLDMLENVVKEFNKTAEIIKLTAKYVNISGHYILSTLKEFAEQSCDVKSLDEALKSVRENFLKTITDHALGAIKELNEKTRHREMSGSDILISSSYHIVSAFQEMTNQVLSLADESRKKCIGSALSVDITPPSGEQKVQSIFSFEPIPQQGKQHKSIKKDEAKSKTKNKITQTQFFKLQDETLENGNNQDLTVEYFPPETILRQNNAQLSNQIGVGSLLKVPDDLSVEYIPLNNILSQQNNKNTVHTAELRKDHVTEKESTNKNFEKFRNSPFSNVNDLTVEVFSPNTNLKVKNGKISNQKYKINKPKDLRIGNFPIKTVYLFNSNNGSLFEKPKELNDQKSSIPNKIEPFKEPPVSPYNVNKHQFTVQIVSPETILQSTNNQLSNQKDTIGESKVSGGLILANNPPKKVSLFQNGMSIPTPEDSFTRKATNNVDRELDSSLVDSLSNVPLFSSEMETTNINKETFEKDTSEKTSNLKPIMNIFDLFQDSFNNENKKQTNCDDNLDPICGFNKINKNLMIFLNDCKREAYNGIYKTSKFCINTQTYS